MTNYADRATVRQLLPGIKPEYIRCRGSRRHALQPENLIWNEAYKFWTATEVCSRCTLRVVTEMNARWKVLARWPEYPEGYLLKGVGVIAGDAFDELRGAYYQQAYEEKKRLSKRAGVKSPPRRTATREALEIEMLEASEAAPPNHLRLVEADKPAGRARKAG